MEVKLPALFENYDKPTDQTTGQLTDRPTDQSTGQLTDRPTDGQVSLSIRLATDFALLKCLCNYIYNKL